MITGFQFFLMLWWTASKEQQQLCAPNWYIAFGMRTNLIKLHPLRRRYAPIRLRTIRIEVLWWTVSREQSLIAQVNAIGTCLRTQHKLLLNVQQDSIWTQPQPQSHAVRGVTQIQHLQEALSLHAQLDLTWTQPLLLSLAAPDAILIMFPQLV
jgi:hypothetical protein